MAAPAQAQILLAQEQALYEIPVDQRIHPELRAEGLAYHGFIYKPRLEISGQYDSNVRAQTQGTQSDYSLVVQPSLLVQKHYDGHMISGAIGGKVERFASLSEENKDDVYARLHAMFDLNQSWTVPLSASYTKTARTRNTPQASLLTKSPEDVMQAHADLGIMRTFNRLSLSLIGGVQDLWHDDGVSLGTNAPVIYKDKDRMNYSATLKTRYKFLRDQDDAGEHIAFADFKYEAQDYQRRAFQNGSFSGAVYDNERYSALAGFETSYKGLLFANLGAGYTKVRYEDAALDDVALMTLSAESSYALTPRINLNAAALRKINQDNDFLQGFKETSFSLGADYELRHNLYLDSALSYGFYDYIDDAREDDNYQAEIGLRYLNSHHLETHLSTGYTERQSTTPAQGFERYHVMLSLVGKI